MEQIYLKIISDIQCLVYVDSEFVKTVEKGVVSKIPLRRGEYFVQLVSPINNDVAIEQVISLEYDRIIQADFEEYLSEHIDLIRDQDIEYRPDNNSFYNLILNQANTPSVYDGGGAFVDGLAIVKRIDKYGCINKLGKEVIACVYDDIVIVNKTDIRVFHDGIWEILDSYGNRVAQHKYIDSDLTLKVVLPLLYEGWSYLNDGLVKIEMNEKYGIITIYGDEIVPCIYDAIDYQGGWISISIDGKFGFFDITGKQVLPCVYDNAVSFFSGWGVVERNNKWGAVNIDGVEIIPFNSWKLYKWEENLIRIDLCEDYKWGLVDKTGKIITHNFYDSLVCIDRPLQNQYVDIYESMYYVDTYDSYDLAFPYGIVPNYCAGLYPVGRDGLCGFVDESGEEVIPCKYDWVCAFNNGMARVGKGGMKLFIDKKDNIILKLDCEEVSDFAEERALIMRNGKCGYIDVAGNEVIPCIYKKARLFNNGVAPVKNSKWYFIDKLGNIVSRELMVDYDEVEMTESELWKVYYSGKYGLINTDGEEILPCVYESIDKLADGVWKVNLYCPDNERRTLLMDDAGNQLYSTISLMGRNQDVIAVYQKSKCGLIDVRGNEIVPCMYDSMSTLGNGMWRARLNDKYGIIGNDGHIVIPCLYDDISKLRHSIKLIKVSINGFSAIVEVDMS